MIRIKSTEIRHADIILQAVAIVLIGTAAHATGSIKPLVIDTYVRSAKLASDTSGYLLTMEMLLTAVGTIVATAWPRRLAARSYLFWVLVAACISNLACIALTPGPAPIYIALRCVSGACCGFGLGRLSIAIALAARPSRAAGLYSVSTQAYGAVAAFIMPVLQGLLGRSALFAVLAFIVPVALVFIRWFPTGSLGNSTDSSSVTSAVQLESRHKVALSIGLVCYYMSIGIFWPFVTVIGAASGLGQTAAAHALGWAGVASVAGSALAVFVGHARTGWLVLWLYVVQIVSLLIQITSNGSQIAFYLCICLYAFAWLALFPTVLGVLSRLDPTGQMNGVSYIIAVTGLAAGPAIGGWLLKNTSSFHAPGGILSWVGILPLVVSGAIVALYAFKAERRPSDVVDLMGGR